MSYSTLHIHTEASNLRLLDCISKPSQILDKAHELGLHGVAFTDHESLSSFIKGEQYLTSKKEVDEVWNNMKFIRGNEIYLCRNGLDKDNYNKTVDRYFHFILLAKDYKGYLQLCELSRRAWTRMFKQYQTRVPTYYNDIIEVIGEEPGHIIGSTACIGSQIGNKLLQVMDNKISLDEAMTFNEAWLRRMMEIMGNDNLYIELQPATSKEQIYVNNHLIELSKITGLPTIITTDAHYINKEDRVIHKAFLKSKNGEREVDEFYEATYMMDEDEIHQRMDNHIGADIVNKSLEQTNETADRVEDYTLLKPLSIPYLPRPEFDEELDSYSVYMGYDQEVLEAIPWLIKYIESGIEANIQFAFRIINFMVRQEGDKRLYQYQNKAEQVNTELEIIWNSGVKQNVEWSKYFLQVADYIKIYWTLGDSLTAPSRGSGGASYICYILGITQIDPTREKAPMIFQRFMNPDRASVLDIDTDIQSNKRNQCIKALQKVYGENHVTRVATFKTEKARSAILTAARALDIDVDTARYISSLVQAERGIQYTLDQTYYGDEENGIKPNKQFVQEMEKYPDLWKISRGIEGLISGLGSHAGGVIITEEPITLTCGIMRTSSGDIVTAYDLHEVEAQSLIKIDLLATEGLTKIRTCIDLLCDYGYAEKKATLRETYEEIVGIYHIDRENPDMWKMVWNNEITSLFQMEQQSGIQGIRLTKPSSLEDLATLNSVIRLMPPDRNAERPLEKFARFKEHPQDWEDEMTAAGLNQHQKQLMHSMFDYSNGISAQQEDLYQLMRCDEIVGYSFGQADKLRKAVAKKNPKDYDAFEEQFWKDVKERGSDLNLCRYIWNEMVKPQKGYSFNLAHCLSYSMVALQEMNLAFYYPIIFWNTANLIVDSGAEYKTYLEDYDEPDEDDESEEEEEEEVKASNSNYGKIATAIGKMQQKGIYVLPPNINESNITYTINVKKNEITYGLKGIEKVGNKVINEIMNNRPYSSVDDFLNKVKVNKTQMVNLIKCGAFDQFGDRQQIMKNYLITVSGGKLKLTLQNLGQLIENDLIPKELYSMNISVFKFNKYLRKFKDKENQVIRLDENAYPIYEEHFDIDKTSIDAEGNIWLDERYWKGVYDSYMDPLRKFIKKNHDSLLEQLNSKLTKDIYEKYASGNLAKWSMDSVNFYQGDHELKNVNFAKYNIKNFKDLPVDPEIERSFTAKDGHIINMFKLSRIAGTVIDKDKLKSQITLLTTDGVVTVQAYGIMPQYDKQISEMGTDGHKHVIEKSWFSRGNKIIVNGMRRGDSTFVAKKYANDPGHHFLLIKEVLPNGDLIIQEERYEVE